MVKVVAEERPGRVVVAWDAPGKCSGTRSTPSTRPAGRRRRACCASSSRASGRSWRRSASSTPSSRASRQTTSWAPSPPGPPRGRGGGHPHRDRDALQLGWTSGCPCWRPAAGCHRHHPLHAGEGRGALRPAAGAHARLRGLVGDSSDNLPGVPGIGEKGAATLIQKYGSLEGVLEHASEQTPSAARRWSATWTTPGSPAGSRSSTATPPSRSTWTTCRRWCSTTRGCRRSGRPSGVRVRLAGPAARGARDDGVAPAAPVAVSRAVRVTEAVPSSWGCAWPAWIAWALPSPTAPGPSPRGDEVLCGRSRTHRCGSGGRLAGAKVACHDAKALPAPVDGRRRG